MQVACNIRVARTLVLSSVAVYGNPGRPEPPTEDTPPAPISLYGITRLAAERAALRLAELHGLDTVAARLGPCFGKREYRTDARALLSPHWQVVETALAGGECVLPRATVADWIDAEEAACAMADLLLAPTLPHTLFNLGGGSVTSVAAWCEALTPLLPGFRWSLMDPSPRLGHFGPRRHPGAVANSFGSRIR
jgi:UDP-glucose 4-epimerase